MPGKPDPDRAAALTDGGGDLRIASAVLPVGRLHAEGGRA